MARSSLSPVMSDLVAILLEMVVIFLVRVCSEDDNTRIDFSSPDSLALEE